VGAAERGTGMELGAGGLSPGKGGWKVGGRRDGQTDGQTDGQMGGYGGGGDGWLVVKGARWRWR